MTEIGALKEAGAVAVTDGNRAVANARVFRRALSYANDFDMLVVQHVEEPTLATGVMNASETASRLGLPGIPAAAEVIMLERDLRLVELTGARYHAAQISCRTSLDVIRAAKARGLAGHLRRFRPSSDAQRTRYRRLSHLLQTVAAACAARTTGAHLVEGVADGSIDVIVSSHDPQSADTKRLPFAEAEFGAIGLETMFSAALSLHHNAGVPLSRLIEAMSVAPANILGLECGRLEPGCARRFRLGRPSERSWKVEDAVSAIALEELALRASDLGGAGRRNGRCGKDCLYLKSMTGGMMVDWSSLSVLRPSWRRSVGYLCGSIPFGLLLTNWAGLGDVRTIGSGNIGATNVLRTGNKKIAALTLILDAAKATVPVLLFREMSGDAAGLVAGFAASQATFSRSG